MLAFYLYLGSYYKCWINLAFCLSSDIKDSFKVAIKTNNTNLLEYLIEYKLSTEGGVNVVKNASHELLSVCYNRGNFIFAEKLIKAGAIFKSEYVITNLIHTHSNLIRAHLEVIQPNIDEREFFRANKIAISIDSPISVVKPAGISCKNYIKILLNITYTDNLSYYTKHRDIYKNYLNSNNAVLINLMSFVANHNYLYPEIKILAPILNDKYGAFHDDNLGLIYTPFFHFNSFESATLAHEIGHYIMHKRFGNNGLPFEDWNNKLIQEYDKAAAITLCNAGKLIGFQCNSSHNLYETAQDLLWNSTIMLFHYNNALQDPESNVKQVDLAVKAVNSRYQLNSTLVNVYGLENVTKAFIKLTVEKQNLTNDDLIFLDRMGEGVLRNDLHEYLIEFIVRLPELIARGLGNKTLSYLEALKDLWLNNVDYYISEACKNEDRDIVTLDNTCNIYSATFFEEDFCNICDEEFWISSDLKVVLADNASMNIGEKNNVFEIIGDSYKENDNSTSS